MKDVRKQNVGNTEKNKFRESSKESFEAFEKITLDKFSKDFQRIREEVFQRIPVNNLRRFRSKGISNPFL